MDSPAEFGRVGLFCCHLHKGGNKSFTSFYPLIPTPDARVVCTFPVCDDNRLWLGLGLKKN